MNRCTETVSQPQDPHLMSDLIRDKATICVVNYKTLDITRLCLRSIRKFTRYSSEVIVVDNDSQDESLEYLRNLSWIRLIERRLGSDDRSGGFAHGAALDIALENCKTEFFVSMHSDVIIQKQNWLTDLIGYFGHDKDVACVGSGKIELKPRWQIILQKATDVKALKRKVFDAPKSLGKFRYHNRTICCVYRTEVLRHEDLSFLMGKGHGLAVGQKLYFELLERGYKTVELPTSIVGQYIIHLAHTTQVANPQEFTMRRSTVKKHGRFVNRVMSSTLVQSILADESLDL
jgi:glycosyltransferase involved in cell wall biosynthesis